MFAQARPPQPTESMGLPALPQDCAIDAQALQSQIGHDYELLRPDVRCTSALMQGSFSIEPLRHGLSLHCTDLIHLQDMTSQFEMREASIKVLLKLEGNAEVFMDAHCLPLGVGEGALAKPQGAVVALNAPATFRRYCRAGSRQRMVVVTLTPAWFDAADMSCDLTDEHLAVRCWKPTPRAIAIAEQLLHPAHSGGAMQRLRQESRALELVAEALAMTLTANVPRNCTITASAQERARRLQRFLDSGEADQLDMRSIAQAMACNASTLQQQFRAVCGQTIFDYLRQQRLRRAAHALQHAGVSVAQAAEIAGYGSQANFSTAYRKHFGLAPKHSRNKI